MQMVDRDEVIRIALATRCYDMISKVMDMPTVEIKQFEPEQLEIKRKSIQEMLAYTE